MKICFQACLLVLISLMIVTDSCADSYRLQGQLFYDNGQVNGKWTRGFKLKVHSEEPVIIKQGKHIVSLLFTIEPPPSNKYTLTASLKTNPNSDDEISTTLFTNTYQSTLVGGPNGPLEFEEEKNGIKFGGAFGMSLRHIK